MALAPASANVDAKRVEGSSFVVVGCRSWLGLRTEAGSNAVQSA
jgi:hypothetical protein